MSISLIASPVNFSAHSNRSESSDSGDSDLARASVLLEQFDVLSLGEGDITAGSHALVVMALALANLTSPRSRICDSSDGSSIQLGMDVFVSGGLSCSLVEDRIFNELRSCQSNLYNHVSEWMEGRGVRSGGLEGGFGGRAPSAPTPLESLEAPEAWPNRDSEILFRSLLRASDDATIRKICDSPLLVATVGCAEALPDALKFAHQGRPLILLSVLESIDRRLLAQVCREMKSGGPRLTPVMSALSGHLIATDPLSVLDQLVSSEGQSNHWIDRLLWLSEHDVGNSFRLRGKSEETKPLWTQAANRYGCAVETVIAARLDFTTPAPMQLNYAFAKHQIRWNSFLRGLEPRFPGVSGTLRSLPASLLFGLWEMVKVDGSHSELFDVASVMAFARVLAVRMVGIREVLHHHEKRTRLDKLVANVRLKLAEGPLTVRDLTRKSHRLSAEDCLEALTRLADSGLVVCEKKQWRLSSLKHSKPLTLDV